MRDTKTTEQIIDECLLLRSRTHPDLLHRLAFVMTYAELEAVTMEMLHRGEFAISSHGDPYLAGVPIMVTGDLPTNQGDVEDASRSRKRGPERRG